MNAPSSIATGGLDPVGDSERVDTIDVLRGFAMFGILLVNIGFFVFPVSEPFYLPDTAGDLDRAVHWLTAVLAQGKFYPLFSFLFGLGFAIQLERARLHGRTLENVHVRRLLVLMAIGLLHGIFIWAGDILVAYAFLGFLLLLTIRLPVRWLPAFAALAYGVQFLLIGGFTLSLAGIHANPHAAGNLLLEMTAGMNEAAALRADAWAAYSAGSYAEITAVRLREFSMALQNMAFFAPQVLAMFLFGAWCGRRGVLANPVSHRRLLKLLLVAGLLFGLPVSVAFAALNADIDYLGMPTPGIGQALLLNLLAGLLMAPGYAAAITLAMQTRAARQLRALAPVGRMALSNYLLQSVICTGIFYSYGLELFAKLSRVEMLGVVLLVFAAQLVLSGAWLARFRFGPVEWLWRSITYLRVQPFRRARPYSHFSRPTDGRAGGW
ncbi:MAG TPA: DUF418 domain-containing protein [Gammaproteobacteria bacterium]